MAKYRNLRMVTIKELMNIVAADTDGHIVAAVTTKGKVEEYENGIHKRTY